LGKTHHPQAPTEKTPDAWRRGGDKGLKKSANFFAEVLVGWKFQVSSFSWAVQP